MEANENLKSMFMCVNCGDLAGLTKKLYCKNCGTAQERKEIAIANAKIKEENLAKGYIYAN